MIDLSPAVIYGPGCYGAMAAGGIRGVRCGLGESRKG